MDNREKKAIVFGYIYIYYIHYRVDGKWATVFGVRPKTGNRRPNNDRRLMILDPVGLPLRPRSSGPVGGGRGTQKVEYFGKMDGQIDPHRLEPIGIPTVQKESVEPAERTNVPSRQLDGEDSAAKKRRGAQIPSPPHVTRRFPSHSRGPDGESGPRNRAGPISGLRAA